VSRRRYIFFEVESLALSFVPFTAWRHRYKFFGVFIFEVESLALSFVSTTARRLKFKFFGVARWRWLRDG
jgi:hypothetical protein